MDNRKKNMNTIPPSTPQGHESNQMLVSPELREETYPAERPGATTGEGSPVAGQSTGIPAPARHAEKHPSAEQEGGPLLEKKGQTPGKKEGRDQHER